MSGIIFEKRFLDLYENFLNFWKRIWKENSKNLRTVTNIKENILSKLDSSKNSSLIDWFYYNNDNFLIESLGQVENSFKKCVLIDNTFSFSTYCSTLTTMLVLEYWDNKKMHCFAYFENILLKRISESDRDLEPCTVTLNEVLKEIKRDLLV